MAYREKTRSEDRGLQPPQAIDAEKDVIGSILKDSEAIHNVIEVLESETHFYSPKHKIIFKAIMELYNSSDPTDIVTLTDLLIKKGELEKVGGRSYLVELVENIASTANVVSHANIIIEKSLLRELISSSTEIVKSCYTYEQPFDTLLDIAEANIYKISTSRIKTGFINVKSLISDTFEQIEKYQSDEGIVEGVKTGFVELDSITQGLHNGDLIVIAGRPSMGKSALSMNIAEYVAMGARENLRKGVGIFSIEMSKEQLVMRMLCSRAQVNQQRLRTKKLSDQELLNLTRAGGTISQSEIFIDDSASLTSLQMRSKARRLKAQYDIGLIIVDYIQMMQASGRHENRQQEIAAISRNLKEIAKELRIPVIAISQLSRMVEQRGGSKRPQLSDLRESGAIEQDADVVMFVFREEFYLTKDEVDIKESKGENIRGKAEIIVSKQRNGPTGTVELVFRKELAKFENMSLRSHGELPPDAEPVGGEDVPF